MNEKRNNAMLVEAIPMPQWLREMETVAKDRVIPGDEAKMRFVIEAAVENVQHETGGPFSAAIFEMETGRLVVLGINVVVPVQQSWAHAEMTAFAHAQNRLNSNSLRGCMLVTSCEPCAMCSGAIPWSGGEKMIYGATREMAEKIGFDEGYKGERWREEFIRRGIRITSPLLGEEAFAPFRLYVEKHGRIY